VSLGIGLRGESELAPNFIAVVIENKVAIQAVEASCSIVEKERGNKLGIFL
jgi:hypothetical protein